MRDHPGRVITIYDDSQIIGKGFPISMTCTNIISGFRKTGIFPFNPSIFKEDDFLSSAVADRQALPETLNEQEPVELVAESSKLPSNSAENFLVSPEQLLAFPKAGPKKQGKKGRKKLKSAILTDTPVKNNIENDLRNREENKIKKLENAPKRTIERLMKQKNTAKKMPQFYKRKEGVKARKKIDPENMKLAAVEALKGESGILTVAKKYNVDRMTLKRYMKKYKDNPNCGMTSNYQKKFIFNVEREAELAEYLKTCAKMHSGLTYRKVRVLAYQLAVENNISRPKTWDINKIAGNDWLKGYMKRNASLSLRTPEATSLSRATSFNKNNLNDFFANLKTILDREKFNEHDIWNVDETGYTTVQKPKKIIVPKGQKQVGQLTSAERGQLVTICCAINAAGRSIPLCMIFPRVNFKPMMLN